jgi:hypothetical protein
MLMPGHKHVSQTNWFSASILKEKEENKACSLSNQPNGYGGYTPTPCGEWIGTSVLST